MVKDDGPITPEEAVETKKEIYPPEVFAAFNEMIVENESDGYAEFNQEEVVARMMDKGLDKNDIYRKGWLNVVSVYKQSGWRVTLDRPGQGETYPTVYVFEKRKTRKS